MIKLLKLTSGEEIVADIDPNGTMLTVKNPVKMAVTREGVAMVPFSPFIKENSFQLPREHVMFTADVEDELHNAYSSQFGGIVLAAPGLTL